MPHAKSFLPGLRSRLGLAAGYDRDGSQLAASAAAGFGFVEIGTFAEGVRGEGQAAAIAERVLGFRRDCDWLRIGISVGSDEDGFGLPALADFTAGMGLFWRVADYLAVNLSSRRHPLRQNYADADAPAFLAAIAASARTLRRATGWAVPVAPKLLLAGGGWRRLVPSLRGGGFAAVIVVSEDDSASLREAVGALAPIPVIAVGGVRSGEDATARLRCGASLVQIHRAYAEGGAETAREIARGLRAEAQPVGTAAVTPASMT